MFRYRAVECLFFSSDLGRYRSFGILAEQNRLGSWMRMTLIADVSCCEAFAAALARTCTRLQLDPLHLPDVVADALS